MKTETQIQQPIIYQQEEERPTILLVIKKKFFLWLEKNRFSKFVLSVFSFLLAITLSALLIFPKEAALALLHTVLFYNAALPKIIFSFFIVYQWKKLLKKLKPKYNQHTIEGIPHSELLHFLFESNGFKLKDFKERFGLSQRIYAKLAKRLEDMKILERGENNARVLSPKYSMEEIREILSTGTKAKELSFWRVNTPYKPQPKAPKQIHEEMEAMITKEEEETRKVKPFAIRQLS